MSETDLQVDTLETLETVPEPTGDAEFSFLDESKEKEPCQNFRLDPVAGFGMCKCGHPKAAHAAKETNKAQEMLTKLKMRNSVQTPEEEDVVEVAKGDGPCGKFRLDVNSTEFGTCKCGYKRADHVAAETNKAKQALDRLKSSNLDKYKDAVMNMDEGGACNNYRVDVSAAEFGTCKCGFKKEDHVEKDENAAAKMLKKLKEQNIKKHEKADAEAMGIVEEEVPEEKEEPVATPVLDKAEESAEKPEEDGKKKKGKGRKGPCVIS